MRWIADSLNEKFQSLGLISGKHVTLQAPIESSKYRLKEKLYTSSELSL
jgi:hypothetical protein